MKYYLLFFTLFLFSGMGFCQNDKNLNRHFPQQESPVQKKTSSARSQSVVASANAPEEYSISLQGGNGGSQGRFIFEDQEGNTIMIGTYQNELPVGENILTGKGFSSYFVAKYNSSGTLLSSYNLLSSEETNFTLESAVAYKSGFIISGLWQAGEVDVLSSSRATNANEAYIIYINENGGIEWIKTRPLSGIIRYTSRSVLTRNDSIFAAFGNGQVEILNQSGEQTKLLEFGNQVNITSIALQGGTLAIGGWFIGDTNIGDIDLTGSDNAISCFVASVDFKTEEVKWARGATAITDNIIEDIQINNDGTVYALGIFFNKLEWDESNVLASTITSHYLTKFDATGQVENSKVLGNSFFNPDPLNRLYKNGSDIYFYTVRSNSLNKIESDFSLTEFPISDDKSFMNFSFEGENLYQTGTLGHDYFTTITTIADNNVLSFVRGEGMTGELRIISNVFFEGDLIVTSQLQGSIDFMQKKYSSNRALLITRQNEDSTIVWDAIFEDALMQSYTYADTKSTFNNTAKTIGIIGYAYDNFKINGIQNGTRGYFFATLSTDGEIQTIKELGVYILNDIALDDEGNIYLAGSISDGDIIDSQEYNTDNPFYDPFVSKFDKDGNLSWFEPVSTSMSSYSSIIDVKDNQIAFSVEFSTQSNQELIFKGNTYQLSAETGDDILISLNTDNTFNWLTTFGGDPTPDEGYHQQSRSWGTNVLINNSNNIILSGVTSTANTFDDQTLTASSNYNLFVAEYGTDGKLIWIDQILRNSYSFYATALDLDAEDNIYAHCAGSDTVSFSNDFQAKVDGIFTVKYNATGDIEWVNTVDADVRFTTDIEVIAEDVILNSGMLYGSIYADSEYKGYGGRSYLLHMGTTQDDNVTGIDVSNQSALRAYPNPFTNEISINLTESYQEEVKISLLDLSGKYIQKEIDYTSEGGMISINLQSLETGTYILSLKSVDIGYSQLIIKE